MQQHAEQSVVVERELHRLAGSLWLPDRAPRGLVLMIPGSGPSDRNNDVLFPPIRQQLLKAGLAVSSFDKRGVGGSSGLWTEAGIVDQALDIVAAFTALRKLRSIAHLPFGVFGHSQGGWVALEVATRVVDLAFVVTNSCPGVSPDDQERFAARSGLLRSGVGLQRVQAAMKVFDKAADMACRRVSFEQFDAFSLQEEARLALDLVSPHSFDPRDRGTWDLYTKLAGYQPRAALEQIAVPLLALFGEQDSAIPVRRSVAAFEEALMHNPHAKAQVFEGADHRLRIGDGFAPSYLKTLSAWIVGLGIAPVERRSERGDA